MKSFKIVFAILIGLGINAAAAAETVKKHQGNNATTGALGELKKFTATEESFEIFGTSENYSDHIRQMLQGNEMTAYDSSENSYRPLDIANQMNRVEKDLSITEFELLEAINIRTSENKLQTPDLPTTAKF